MAALVFTVSACSKSGSKGTDTTINPPGKPGEGPIPVKDPVGLVTADIVKMRSMSTFSAATWDASHSGIFTKIYGGTSAAAIAGYFDERISYFLTPDQMDRLPIQPSQPKYTGWYQAADDALVGASNYGIAIWLQSAIDRTPVQIFIGGGWIPVESGRIGLMAIGPGYFEQVRLEDGRVITIPPAYRQAILLHEARHSDCTKGITQADLDIFRNSKSLEETDRKMTARECGHLHTFCPAGHELAGLSACDVKPWGPYAVQDVFLAAIAGTYSGTDKRILDATQIDSRSRLLYNTTALYNGLLGWPDMENKGVLD